MIPVNQTKFAIKNSNGEYVQRGNCYAACIASMLEVPITEVPNVEVFFDMESGFWSEVMMTFLNHKGWDLCSDIMLRRFHPNETGGFNFMSSYNPEKREERFIDDYYKYKDKFYLVSGDSPRGIRHMCIYQNGLLVHDPHPSKDGLINFHEFQTLDKKEA